MSTSKLIGVKMSRFITMKEIGELVGVSYCTVQRRRAEWGLDDHIARALLRPILFHREPTLKLLRESGLLPNIAA